MNVSGPGQPPWFSRRRIFAPANKHEDCYLNVTDIIQVRLELNTNSFVTSELLAPSVDLVSSAMQTFSLTFFVILMFNCY